MPIDWKKVFSDKGSFPDDTKFTLGGEEVTIGQLREHNTQNAGETQKALEAREQSLNVRETNTREATTRLANIVESVARSTGLSFEQIIAGDTAAAAAAAERVRQQAGKEGISAESGKIDWKGDPIYAPINERFAPVEATLQQTQVALKAGLTVMSNDRARLAYIQRRLDHPEEAKNLKFEDVLKTAAEKGYKDEVGFLDAGRAMDDMMAPGRQSSREADLIAKAKEEGAAEARKAMMGSVPEPGGGGVAGLEFQQAPDKAARPSTIAEQLTKAMNDPAIFNAPVN